ncbi:MAG: glutamate--tRNA ligase [Bacteroidota bacterium]
MAVRVRFAPSPTGGLHIGGVRTALFNYLFAKKQGGTFILRIEDTDQTRFVAGAEEYIKESLAWLGLDPDEGVDQGGAHAPYRQSERKEIYHQYVQRLLDDGKAYYAFDTQEELETMREKLKSAGMANLNYNSSSRMTMKNSLTLPADDVQQRIASGEPYVIRVKVPAKDEVRFQDLIRGWVMVHTVNLDDKVLMKSDGLPTYHLANIVDDHLMGISHVIRGEEWLPSAPLHVLLYKFFGWEDSMPEFAHLPLILKPDGNGKLSKRAADKMGFPIFPLDWTDPSTGELSVGFREKGYLPAAMVNFLAFLGWNPGSERELFSLDELIEEFSLDRVGKAGTKFDIDKAKWFNEYYLRNMPSKDLADSLLDELADTGTEYDQAKAIQIVDLLKPRVSFFQELVSEATMFVEIPKSYEEKTARKKWNSDVAQALQAFAEELKKTTNPSSGEIKELLSDVLQRLELGMGRVMPGLRLSVTGQSSGPDLMVTMEILGPLSVADRIYHAIDALKEYVD